ncbi:hypothetical protein PFI31113_03846 [Pandoraea fibrosis]|uniref:Uncharacterized protein n=2 Tax=Pandoraea fibrosis TaxID=1891094 RepID=A0A5E4XHG9_9BURK|nr:hypothetical protein PFI31113_03846 [Pandoraea fibrosis]
MTGAAMKDIKTTVADYEPGRPRPHRGRTPAHLERVGGKTNRQRVWDVLRTADEPLRLVTLSFRAKADDLTVKTYLQGLVKAGYVEAISLAGKGACKPKVFRIIRNCGVDAPRVTRDGKPVMQGLGNEQMWRAMRIIGPFDFRVLAARSSTPEVRVSDETARAYVQALYNAGYLQVVRQYKPGLTAQYMLPKSKVTGPHAPMIQRVNQVFDPNTNRVVWTEQKGIDDEG